MLLYHFGNSRYEIDALWFISSVSCFLAIDPVLKSWSGQGRINLLSRNEAINEYQACFEINTGIFASDRPPDRNICSCSSAPKNTKTEMGSVDLGRLWAVMPLNFVYSLINFIT
ncbi:hypothetical protein TNCV_870511 [Trichonephila clavipes]|nr:hypothetical protein TNCV_870511 [Trichonephila clavipes]